MVRVRTALAAALSAAVIFSACAREEETKLQVDAGLAARIGDVKITEKKLDDLIDQLSPQARSDFRGREGRARYVDTIIDEELLYLAAKDSDIIYDDEVREQMRRAEMSVLITAYFDKNIRRKAEVTETEIERYYNDNWHEFMNQAVIKAQHIFSTDSLKVVGWKKRIEAGELFNKIAKEESEDERTALTFGNLGYFNPGGYVMFYGVSQEFSSQVSHLEPGEMSGVVVTEKGYSLVRINEKNPESIKPLAEVRQQIVEKLRSEKAKGLLDREIAALRERHRPVNFVRNRIVAAARSPEELWAMAQEAGASYTRILYYRTVVNQYPEHEFAPQALFMIGFVYAEELQNLVDARHTFEELLRKYPDADVVESAKWMIENLDKAHPRFESIEDLHEKMQADRQE